MRLRGSAKKPRPLRSPRRPDVAPERSNDERTRAWIQTFTISTSTKYTNSGLFSGLISEKFG